MCRWINPLHGNALRALVESLDSQIWFMRTKSIPSMTNKADDCTDFKTIFLSDIWILQKNSWKVKSRLMIRSTNSFLCLPQGMPNILSAFSLKYLRYLNYIEYCCVSCILYLSIYLRNISHHSFVSSQLWSRCDEKIVFTWNILRRILIKKHCGIYDASCELTHFLFVSVRIIWWLEHISSSK